MKTTYALELADVKAIAAAAEGEALANQWAVSIAIVDAGGHLLSLQRLDGAAPISAQIAPAKAQTAALGRRESRIYEEMIKSAIWADKSEPQIYARSRNITTKLGAPSFAEIIKRRIIEILG